MKYDDGFFKLYRNIFTDTLWLHGTPTQKLLMVVCIGKANHEPNEWHWMGEKFAVKRGQFVTSIGKLKKHMGKGISTQNIRGALKNLEKYHFLTMLPTKAGRLITVLNYNKYQYVSNIEGNKEVTKTQQRGNKEVTPNKNDKNNKNDKKKIIDTDKIIAKNGECKEIFKYWNSKKIIQHRVLDEATERRIKAMLNIYTMAEIKRTIHIYSVIIKDEDDEYYFHRHHTLKNFLSWKYEEFKSAEVAHNSFLKFKGGKSK